MSEERLDALTEAAGLIGEWQDSKGCTHRLDDATRPRVWQDLDLRPQRIEPLETEFAVEAVERIVGLLG